ncbi:MAG: HDOD domain-containing protein, partial [candidate division Zixibacteria bacterium]|nr:HDOD domain-containing protein [candidate division Zixibacteria bacterium]
MDNDLIQKVLNDSSQLYSLPQTLVEVLRVTREEKSSADDLAGVLAKDPALTTRVLRVVNSPYYGMARQVSSIKQAVVMIGMRQVTALALSASVYRMTDKWESTLDRMRFWRHSLSVSIAARSIAEKAGNRNLEEVFVAGLLHDIGLLILENSFPEEFRKIWKEAGRKGSLVDLEEEAWGTNHARVGQFLLEQWQIPAIICEAVGRHHNVFTLGADDAEFIPGQIVNLANRISPLPAGERRPVESDHERESKDIIRENLRLTTDDLLHIERNLLSNTVKESKYLEIDVGSNDDLLLEANRLLFDQYASVERLLSENRRLEKQRAGDQVKRGYLESFKSTATALTKYLDQSSTTILQKARRVEEGIESGSIIDPEGVVR